MAKIGFRYVRWGKIATEPANAAPTYDTAVTIGKAVSGNLQWTRATAEFYADDALAESIDEIVGGTYSMDVDNVSLSDQAAMTGATYDSQSSTLTNKVGVEAPYGGIGGVQVLMHNGVLKYRGYFFPKTKANAPDETYNTRSNSPSFGTEPLNFTLFADNTDRIRDIAEFSTFDDAKSFVDGKFA